METSCSQCNQTSERRWLKTRQDPFLEMQIYFTVDGHKYEAKVSVKQAMDEFLLGSD